MKLGEAAGLLCGELRGGDASAELKGLAGLEDAVEGDLTFVAAPRFLKPARKSRASFVLVSEYDEGLARPQIIVKDPHLAFLKLMDVMRPRPKAPEGISPLAFVDPAARLGQGVSLMPFAYVGAGAEVGAGSVLYPGVYVGQGSRLGEGCVLYPGVVLMDGVTLGNRVVIHAGTVVGSDGYGYIQRGGRHVKVPQAGGVTIADDVEVGANTAIDRATLGQTEIGQGTKIDNLVQIAHNVKVGEHCLLAGMSAVAGSSTLGNYNVLAGRAALGDHVKFADNVTLTGGAGAASDITEPGAYSGIPAVPMRDWLRSMAIVARLPEMAAKLRELEAKIDGIEKTRGA